MLNLNINNFNSRDYNQYKLFFKYNSIKNTLQKNDFILFFYYDFLNHKTRLALQKSLKNNNLRIVTLKKNSTFNLLSQNKFKFLKNIINENIILIYNENNEIVDSSTIKKLIKTSNLKLIGCLWNKKFYRSYKIKKYINLPESTKYYILLLLKKQLNEIKLTLTTLNKN